MGKMARALRTGWIVVVAGAVALVAACSLNPQPIPPGFTNDGTAVDSGAPANLGGGGTATDAGDFNASDSGLVPTLDGSPDGSLDDAGDAGDSGDQDASDAGDQ